MMTGLLLVLGMAILMDVDVKGRLKIVRRVVGWHKILLQSMPIEIAVMPIMSVSISRRIRSISRLVARFRASSDAIAGME